MKIIFNKNYVVVNSETNVLITATYTESEAASIASVNDSYEYYRVGKYVTFEEPED